MTWHAAYRERVLEPDYTFASRHLKDHLIDALVAHVRTVAELPAARERGGVVDALEGALVRVRSAPTPPYAPTVPDLYYAVQHVVAESVGEEALGWLRLGLSRNDLDMTIYKLRAREVTLATIRGLLAVQAALLDQADAHVDSVMVAYTHHQPGQPTTVAHYLAAVASVVERDVERALQAFARLDTSPMGAAALAGSSHGLDRDLTARLLGFAGPVVSTYDAVAASDWQIDVANVAVSVSITMSRLVCDLVAWSSQGLLRVGDGLTQGSSIMPQKRNPVALEHARTRFSRALGAAQSIVLSSHNIPFGDLNDFGPDVQGSLQTLHNQLSGGLALVQVCLAESTFDDDALTRSLERTNTTATELADELVRIGGCPFQDAHRWVGALVARMANEDRPFALAEPADLIAVGGPTLHPDVLRDAVSPHAFVARRTGLGGPAPESVRVHLRALRDRSDEYHGAVDHITARIEHAAKSLRASRKDVTS
ncbi:MAG: argininosuccinate lyase [Trueperaceae bacterium]|nr:argininosuccinate lyase [Trueperaceae bacterium]